MSAIEEQLRRMSEQLNEISQKVQDMDSVINGYPATYKLYKGVRGNNGAIQFDLTPIWKSRRDLGAVFVQAAPAVGPNEYDWDQKITIALNLSDIATILNTFRAPPKPGDDGMKLYHDKGKGTNTEGQFITTMSIQRGNRGGFSFALGRTENGNNRFVRIPVSDGEAIEIRILLEQAVKKILGW